MRKLLFTAVALLASVATFAQQPKGTLTVQPKLGLSIASLTNDDGADPHIGVVAGAELEYQASDIVSVSFGALYSMQGDKAKDEDISGSIKLDYINIPILANIYVAKGLAVKFGLQPGFNISSKVNAKTQGISADVDINGVNTVDLAIPIGLSYEYRNFVIDGRYNFGVTKWGDDISIAGQTISTGGSKNSVFQITLGYKIAL